MISPIYLALCCVVAIFLPATVGAQIQRIDAFAYSGSDLSSVALAANGAVIACGDHGVLLTSSDGGRTYIRNRLPVLQPEGVALTAVVFTASQAPATHAIVVGMDGIILHTTSANQFMPTWRVVESGTVNHLHAVAHSGALTMAVGANGTVLLSRDGGNTWALLAPPLPLEFYAVASPSPGHFVVAGEGGIVYRYNDQTREWAVGSTEGNAPNTCALRITSMLFTSAMQGWATTTGGVMGTTDGGNSWRCVHTFDVGDDNSSILHIHRMASGRLVASGQRGALWVSNDSMATSWQRHSNGDTLSIACVASMGDSLVYVGEHGTVGRVSAVFSDWTPIGQPLAPMVVSLATRGTSFVGVGMDGLLLRSPDGMPVRDCPTCPVAPFLLASAMSPDVTVIADSDGRLHWSSDEGQSWQLATVDEPKVVMNIVWSGAFYGAADGSVLRSSDGQTWTTIGRFDEQVLLSVAVLSSEHIVVCGYDGFITFTTDGGSTWQVPEVVPTTAHLSALCVVGTNTIRVAGYEGAFLISTDGGRTFALDGVLAGSLSRFTSVIHQPERRLTAATTAEGNVLIVEEGTAAAVVDHVGQILTSAAFGADGLYVGGANGYVGRWAFDAIASVGESTMPVLAVRPNPARQTDVWIDLPPDHGGGTLRVIDPAGQVVVVHPVNGDDAIVRLDVMIAASGIYSIQLVSAAGTRISHGRLVVLR